MILSHSIKRCCCCFHIHGRPGKHFVYFQQYTLFLIELAASTQDLCMLRVLHRKMLRTDDVLLDKEEALLKLETELVKVVEMGGRGVNDAHVHHTATFIVPIVGLQMV